MFKPWVGEHFNASDNLFNGQKILVVGESHYHSAEYIGGCIPDFTQETVRKHIAWEKNKRIASFSKIATFLTGVPASSDWKLASEVWNHIAFYNYIPVFVGSKAREFVDPGFWQLGTDEFDDVLDTLSPDLIVVLGYRLWNNAYHRHSDGAVDRWDNETPEIITLSRGVPIPTVKIKHPAARFSGMSARHVITPHLKQAIAA